MSPKASPALPAPRSRSRLSTPAGTRFDQFVGIDWSGAEKTAGAIAVASMTADGLPQKPDQVNWSRTGVVNWLNEQADKGTILAGLDFAFAHPFHNGECYYPGASIHLDSPRALWREINKISEGAPDYYARVPVWNNPLLGDYYFFGDPCGKRFDRTRFRTTERAACALGCAPSCSFLGMGPAGVASGSLAGMRVLHKIASDNSSRFAIWPFDCPKPGQSVLVEIYPALFFYAYAKISNLTPAKHARKEDEHMRKAVEELNESLAHFGAAPLPGDYKLRGKDLDERDAIVSAAALRHLSRSETLWDFPCEAKKEGWIFGVEPN